MERRRARYSCAASLGVHADPHYAGETFIVPTGGDCRWVATPPLFLRWLAQTHVARGVGHTPRFSCFGRRWTAIHAPWRDAATRAGCPGGGTIHAAIIQYQYDTTDLVLVIVSVCAPWKNTARSGASETGGFGRAGGYLAAGYDGP